MKWLLKGKPYKVQQAALDAADGREGFGYFLDCGLGKTATALAEFVYLLNTGEVDCMVVICPNSMKSTWKNEAREWDVGRLPISIWPETPEHLNFLFVMNYEATITKGGEELQKIMKGKKVYLVLDESIHIKNPRAKRTKRLLFLSGMAARVRVLSGEPIVQSPLDIWAQLRFIRVAVRPNPYAFRNKFCKMGGWQGKQIVGTKNEELLNNIINRHSFKARKEDWTDLPERLYATRHYEMTKEQSDAYKEMLSDFMLELKEGIITAPMAITQMGKLQQISSGFILNQNDRHDIVSVDKNPKIKIIEEFIEENPTKILIFCHFKKSVEDLAKHFSGYCAVLRGGMTPDEIDTELGVFNKTNIPLGICQTASAKYGLTLLGMPNMPCHNSIYYENTFSLDARIQSEARNHRHGQHYPVTYTDLVGSPIEAKVIKALQKKHDIAKAIMGWAHQGGEG
jgi:SNF2 family DNA or RNA helicase